MFPAEPYETSAAVVEMQIEAKRIRIDAPSALGSRFVVHVDPSEEGFGLEDGFGIQVKSGSSFGRVLKDLRL